MVGLSVELNFKNSTFLIHIFTWSNLFLFTAHCLCPLDYITSFLMFIGYPHGVVTITLAYNTVCFLAKSFVQSIKTIESYCRSSSQAENHFHLLTLQGILKGSQKMRIQTTKIPHGSKTKKKKKHKKKNANGKEPTKDSTNCWPTTKQQIKTMQNPKQIASRTESLSVSKQGSVVVI